MYKSIEHSFYLLKDYCEREGYKGWDPYDGLNSEFFSSVIPKNKLTRLVWIQGFKRSPVNLRKVVRVKKDYNPKALGLFLSGYCSLYKLEANDEYLNQVRFLINKINGLSSNGWKGTCWGYNFDWQARAFFQPKYTPTVVASTFIANALLDAYEITNENCLLDTARSTCKFILEDLNRTYNNTGEFAFSYSPLDNSVVFNASLLGSKLLARVYKYTGEEVLIEAAKKSVSFCCNYQKNDGSWSYGTYSFHQWIDNFHTGYNLECISDYMEFSGDRSYEQAISKGYNYYINTFFTEHGISKYYNNSTYPIDIHAPAQLIVTLHKLNKFKEQKELIDKVLGWTIDNMQSKHGYFYYQLNKHFSSKIPYMRWAQAWMFYAFSIYLLNKKNEQN